MPERRILMGVVGRPHGVRGLVRVHSHAADPAGLTAYGPLSDERGRRWTLAWKGEGIAELRDEAGHPLPDRTAAERLASLRLYVDRAQLPPPEEDEWYLSDLVGLAVFDTQGTRIGTVRAVQDYGAGSFLEIAREDAAELLVPFTRAAVPEVDVPAGRLVVDPPHETEAPADAA